MESTDKLSVDLILTDSEGTMATVLYARVSTSEQTIEHQRTQAEKAGFKLDQVIWDDGVSGVSTKLASVPRAAVCSTCSATATRLSCAGSTALAGTTRTSATRYASSCGAALSSAR